MLAAALFSLASLATPGCLVDDSYPLPADFATCAATEPSAIEPGAAPQEPITYYRHAKPIIDAKCAGCHSEGGIGPFALDTYDDAYLARDHMRAAVLTGVMPPWQPNDCCQDYLWDRSLSKDELALLTGWIDQGGLAGDPADEGPPLDYDRGGLSRVDVTVTMPEPFTPTPLIGRDEVRCFVLDWPVTSDVYVRGINVVPGERSMVHHVVVATVSSETAAELRKREGEDGRPGWDCHGELGADPLKINVIGGWAPGYQGVEFPDELGKKVPAGSTMVLNMHYDLGRGSRQDQTSVELMLTDKPTRELTGTAVANPLWLLGDTLSIPASAPDTRVYFSWDPTLTSHQKPFTIYSAGIHMHEYGSSARLAILRADGSVDCLLDIPRWDFDWLSDYYLEKPVRFEPGDQLFVECHWDNTASHQKIVDGEIEKPRDLSWGTDEEMCAGYVGIVEDE